MATQTDFWGEIQGDKIRTPVAILREQAGLLGPKTQNLIEAKVESSAQGGEFTHSFNLVVPALDRYKYKLFAIHHNIKLYPIRLMGSPVAFKDEAAFTSWLRTKLSSPDTKKLIASLLAQANGD